MAEGLKNSGDGSTFKKPTPRERIQEAGEVGRILKRPAHIIFRENDSTAIFGDSPIEAGEFPPERRVLDALQEAIKKKNNTTS